MTYTTTELNRKIEFLTFTLGQDPDDGSPIESWDTFAYAFAKVEPLVGREFWAAQAVQAEKTVKFTLRWRGDLTPAMRIVFDGKTYKITSIQNIRSANRELLIYGETLQ